MVAEIVQDIYYDYSCDVEQLLRKKYRLRNEKYYFIILKAREQLISTSFKLNLTANAIIKDSGSARPTWYTYFKSVEDYYKEVLEILGSVMLENAFVHLRSNATYKDWIRVTRSLGMMIFLSNTKNLTAFFPDLRDKWCELYDGVIEGYADILSPILKLSPNRAKLFIKIIVNEMVIRPDKYADQALFERFADRKYILFLTEQNS